MATASLGTKRECTKCSAKFYDLGANPVVCPKCGTTQKLDAKPKSAKRVEPPKPKKPVKKPVIKEDDDALEELDDAAPELEDMDELDDGAEVISLEEVEDHQEEEEVDPNSDDAEDGMFIEDLGEGNDLFDSLNVDSEEDEESDEESEASDDEDEEDDDRPKRKRKRK